MPKNAGNLIFELQFLKIFWGGHASRTPLGASVFGTCNLAPSAPSMLKYKSPPFLLGFPVIQSPSTSFTKVRVGSPAVGFGVYVDINITPITKGLSIFWGWLACLLFPKSLFFYFCYDLGIWAKGQALCAFFCCNLFSTILSNA